MERPLEAAWGLLSGRTGRVALVAVLIVMATVEARLSRPSGAGVGRAIVLDVLAVGPLLMARRWPTAAAVAATVVTVGLLSLHQPQLSVAPFCAMLVLLVQLVIRRGFLVAAPLLIPFLINA